MLNPVWAWTDPAGRQALASREVGAILRAYRVANRLSQEKLAEQLGYDKTYISMIETGRRIVQDVATRRHIARVLALPAHLLGVTEPADTEFVAMLAFAESTIRLADLARAGGHAAAAVNELWPMVARLEARAQEGHLERATLAVLGRAWVSLGVCLGTVLPEERLPVAAAWTGKGLAAAEHIGAEDPSGLVPLALAMHGNELRKSGQSNAALTVLGRAVSTARGDAERGAALALLARAAGATGHRNLYEQTCRDALAETPSPTPAPTPQWTVIEQITVADVRLAAGDTDGADVILLPAIEAAAHHRLPHQIQRIGRIAARTGNQCLARHAAIDLAAVASPRILRGDDRPLNY